MNSVIKKTLNKLHQYKIDKTANNKLKKISRNIPDLKSFKELENDYINLWSKLGKKPSVLFQRCMSSLSGVESSLYVPENIHYGLIEPILNNRTFSLIYNDKNFFERYLINHKHLFPKAILRGINGLQYDADYNRISGYDSEIILNSLNVKGQLVLKPATETGGGSNVLLIEKADNGFLLSGKLLSTSELVNLLKNRYQNNFVLQHKLEQNPYFSLFNESSLNTVRLYTYRSVKDETVNPIRAYIRFGKQGSLVDSSSQGGRTCGVDTSNGILNKFALGKYGEKYHDLECLKQNGGTRVPFFNEMVLTANEIAPLYNYHRLLGFDFSVDINNNVRLLEVNNLYIGIINQQMNSGPLFGKFTDEVIEYCLTHKKSFFFHFYI